MKNLYLLITLICFTLTANASEGWKHKPFERKAFIENKGQFNERLPIQYQNFSYCIDNGTQLLFNNNSIVYHFSKNNTAEFIEEERTKSKREKERESEEEEMKKLKTTHQYITLQWLNANPNATIEVSNKTTADYGYIIKKPNTAKEHFTQHCAGYTNLTIKNLYNGIDAEYFFNQNEGFKYNLIVSAGADVSQVKFTYEGAKNVYLKNNELHIKTLMGDMIEHAPVSFKTANANDAIQSSFSIVNNVVSFNIAPQQTNFTIDPWVTVPGLGGAQPVDNGTDKYGNSYITSPGYILEKYSPTGVMLFSIDVMAGAGALYGDMLSNASGTCFFNTVGFHARGDATAVDSLGNLLWDSFGITECWRFVQNECTNQVFSLSGYRHSASGFATINSQTGALSGYTQSGGCCQDPHSGAIDGNGDVYAIASDGGTTQIFKWSSANALLATYPCPGAFGYFSGYYTNGQGLNGMALLGSNLYIYDGATLFKVNKNTGAVVQQITVPNGTNKANGGLYITSCGSIFVGSGTGVYLYDLNFNQIDFKATTGAVYDIAFNSLNQTIMACGMGHITELGFVIPPCIFKKQPDIKGSCNGAADGYINLNVTGGVPDYSYVWTKDGLPFPGTTDSIGGLSPGKYFCSFNDNLCPINNRDTITIVVPSITTPTLNFIKKDVTCYNKNNGEIAVTINPVPPTYTVAWLPLVNSNGDSLKTLLNITKLDTGKYVVLVDALKCIVKDSITITEPDSLILNTLSDISHCESATAIDPISAVATGGTTAYTYNWVGTGLSNTSAQSTVNITGATTTLNISVDVTDVNGCKSKTQSMKLTINPLPQVSFSTDSVCFNTATTFTDATTLTSGSIKTWAWIFGGTAIVPTPTSALQNPTFMYDKCNNAPNNATLIVTSDSGCVNTLTQAVTVRCLPVPNFTFSNGCEKDDNILFTNTSTNGAGTTGALISKWRLGLSPLPIVALSPSQVYNAPGNYSINLIATDKYGCTETVTKSLVIYPKPTANFTIDSVCLNVANTFTNTTTLSVPAGFNDVMSAYNWTYNYTNNYTTDAITASSSHIYTLPATQAIPTVALIVKTNNNCADTITKPAIVWTLPKAKYSMDAPCFPTPILFTNASTLLAGIDNSTMASMNINWGNGQSAAVTALNSTLNYNHAMSGNYATKLTVETNHGCKDSMSVNITIHAKPVADYTAVPLKGCEPLCVAFTNASTQNASPIGETIASYNWRFGDYNAKKSSEDKSTNTNPTHCYDNPTDTTQLHTPTLIVTTTEGCTDTLTYKDSIVVYPLPMAGFKVTPAVIDILNPELKIKDESHLATTIVWNYNNGDVKQVSNPNPLQSMGQYVYNYTDSGTYIIKQTTITDKGCRDSVSHPVRVNPIYTIYVPNTFTPNDDGINDYFMVRGINIKELSLIVFDRYGEVIARIQDISSKGWDGTDIRQGKPCQQEVYNWKLEYTDVFNTKHKGLVGTVTLIK
ncbi:MAG: T9SS type B sorting domain-containing protein [Bacteroidia bacterium]